MKLRIFGLIILLIVGSSSFKCGVPKIQDNEEILRGHTVTPGSFPWQAALYQREGRSEVFMCSGILISSMYLLTADHCVKGVSLSEHLFARLGVHNLDETNQQTTQHYTIFKIHRRIESQHQQKNAIALLELDRVAVFDDYVYPACINQEVDIRGISGVAVGWGFPDDDQASSTLKAAKMEEVSTETCLRDNLNSQIFYADYANGTTICNGDSGCGLFVKRRDTWYLVGISSMAVPKNVLNVLCNTHKYAEYINVATYVPWIRNVTSSVIIRDGQDVDPGRGYPNNLPEDCGNSLVNRIFAGTPADMYEFPWMALLAYREELSDHVRYLCGGSLINKRYVLTAAHCIHPAPFQVRLGEYDLSRTKDCNPNDLDDCAPPVQDIDINYIVHHQRYSPYDKKNDIALVRLSRDVHFDDHIQPICLPVTQTLKDMVLQQYIVTGFGRTSYRETSDILMKATISAVSRTDCQRFYRNYATLEDSHICAGSVEDKSNICRGDSGVPLGYPVRHNGVRFVQFGVASFGKLCGTVPSLYTNVVKQMGWIMANMQA